MDIKYVTDVVQNIKDKSNKDLLETRDLLHEEFDKTKELIIELTKHLEIVQEHYESINVEIGKRIK